MPELTSIIPYTPKSASAQASLDFFEDTDNGTNKITITPPAAIASDKVQTLQDETGTIALTKPRAATVASSATPTPAGDTTDLYTVTALTDAAELRPPSGTPTDGQAILIRIKDDGTPQALTYDGIYREIGVTLPTTTVAGKTIYLGCVYNSADSKWDVLGVAEEA